METAKRYWEARDNNSAKRYKEAGDNNSEKRYRDNGKTIQGRAKR